MQDGFRLGKSAYRLHFHLLISRAGALKSSAGANRQNYARENIRSITRTLWRKPERPCPCAGNFSYFLRVSVCRSEVSFPVSN